jgi:DoxX-like family
MHRSGLSAAPANGAFIMSNLAASNESIQSASRWPTWTGRALSVLVILFLVMDAGMKIAALPIVTESAVMVGWTADPGFWRAMGLLLLAITALYAWPRTAVLGAILITGFLGGAVATHLRMSDPLFSHTLFGVYLGIALWGGLWLRDARVRNLLPIS